MSISFTTIIKYLFLAFSIILIGHIGSVFFIYGTNELPVWGNNVMFDMFFFENEKNITALYSAALFIVLSMFFKSISSIDIQSKKQWMFLSYLAIYLGCDEWFAIHDTIWNVKGTLFGIQYWIWIYFTLLVVLSLFLIKFVTKMDGKLRGFLFLSGFIFILGAGVFETLNPHSGFHTIAYQGYLMIEDGLEMLGVLIAIIGCSHYLKRHNIGHIVFPKIKTSIVSLICGLDLVITYFIKA